MIDAYRNVPELWDIESLLYKNWIKRRGCVNILINNFKPIESDETCENIYPRYTVTTMHKKTERSVHIIKGKTDEPTHLQFIQFR